MTLGIANKRTLQIRSLIEDGAFSLVGLNIRAFVFILTAKPVELSTDPNLPNVSQKNPVAHLNELRQRK